MFAFTLADFDLDELALTAVEDLPDLQGFNILVLNGNLGLFQVRHQRITILSRFNATKPPAISLENNVLAD